MKGKELKKEAEEIAKEMQKSELNKTLNNSGFIWNEEDLIKSKVFPIDLYDKIFYYGLLLPKITDKTDRNGNIIGRKQRLIPCLITSKKNFIEITDRLKEDWKMEFNNIPTFLPTRWNLEKIKIFLEGKTEKVDGKELLNKIEEQYKKYIYIRNPVWYAIHSLWDIGTYLYVVFEAYPLFEMRGITGTAKSKRMVVSSYISFNCHKIMVNPSESTLFRETDEVRGAKYFDEAEKLWVFNKATKRYEGDVRTELINASYTKEGSVPRQEKIGNKFITKWYSPYSPCQLSSISGLFGTTETRAITEICTKSPNEDSRGEEQPEEDRENPIWAEIRDECYRFALENWEDIKLIYNNLQGLNCGLKKRDLQIWKPLLALAKFIGEREYQEILNFAIELSGRRLDDLVTEDSFDYLVLESLRKTITENPDTKKQYVNLIKMSYCDLKGNREGIDNIYLNRNISNHLDRIGFKELRHRDKSGSYFEVSRDIFNEIVSPICPKLVFLSSSSTLSTPLYIKEENKGDDKVMIDDDKNKKEMTMMTINDDNVDDKDIKHIKIPAKEKPKQALINIWIRNKNKQKLAEYHLNEIGEPI